LKRICHLSSVHHADDVRIFGKECRSLSAAGYETHLIVVGHGENERDSVKFHYVSQAVRSRIARIAWVVPRVYLTARALRADLYHFHDPELLPVGWLLRVGGAAVVYDAHEDLPRDIDSKPWIPKSARRWVARVVDCVEVFLSRRMSAVVAATPTICDRFSSAGCCAVTVRNYPISAEFVSGPHKDFGCDTRRSVGYVGGISAIRGSEIMVRAAGMAGVNLILAGRVSEDERQSLEACGAASQVCFKGCLGRSEVAEMLDECFAGLVVLQPTQAYRDSLPIKLFEYMAAGIPVIASNFESWQRLLADVGCGVTVDPTDPFAVATAIRELDSNRARAQEMGLRGREAFLSRFSWALEEPRLIELYQSLLGEPPTLPGSILTHARREKLTAARTTS